MNILLLTTWLAAFGQVTAVAPYPAATGDPTFTSAQITSEKDRIISAEAEGTLIKLPINEGTHVSAGDVLATIDDRQARAAVEVAKFTLEAALERATDEVEYKFAVASAKLAKVDWDKDLAANRDEAGSVTDIQIKQKELAFTRANLQIEKALKDQLIAKKEAAVKEAELSAANIGLARRTVSAPFDGEVQQLFQKDSQWVNPGDPILRLVKFDTLRVECFVKANQFDPVELAGRPVTVRVHLARDREAALPGRITFVDQTVLSGAYRVRAEVQNQREGDFWLIRPGLLAEMTVHLSQPAMEAKALSDAAR